MPNLNKVLESYFPTYKDFITPESAERQGFQLGRFLTCICFNRTANKMAEDFDNFSINTEFYNALLKECDAELLWYEATNNTPTSIDMTNLRKKEPRPIIPPIRLRHKPTFYLEIRDGIHAEFKLITSKFCLQTTKDVKTKLKQIVAHLSENLANSEYD